MLYIIKFTLKSLEYLCLFRNGKRQQLHLYIERMLRTEELVTCMLYLSIKYWKSCLIEHGISACIEKILKNLKKNLLKSREEKEKKKENETAIRTSIIFKRQKMQCMVAVLSSVLLHFKMKPRLMMSTAQGSLIALPELR